MSGIRFGLRTVKVKTYELNRFNITKEEAESFAVDYDGFDIWNFDKTLTVKTPQIEKRVKYFHIMFIPFFPTEVHWTTRNKNGLFKINELCEKKVKSVYPKSYGPWYSFLAPIICLAFVFSYFTVDYVNGVIRKNDYADKIENDGQRLIKQLDSISTPFYLILKTPSSYFSKSFQRVDSIHNKQFYLSRLPHQIDDTISSSTLDYSYHALFKKFKLINSEVTQDSILSIIPKTIIENSSRNENYKLKRIVSVEELENPNLEFKFFLNGIFIKNLGKPITLIDFENKSIEKDKWTVKTNEFIDSNKSVKALYSPSNETSNETSDESHLFFIFSDNDNFYEYEVKGTYKKSYTYTVFIDKSVKKID